MPSRRDAIRCVNIIDDMVQCESQYMDLERIWDPEGLSLLEFLERITYHSKMECASTPCITKLAQLLQCTMRDADMGSRLDDRYS